MFGMKKRLAAENAALRAELAALRGANGAEAPEASAPEASAYWTEDGERIYSTPGWEVAPIAERILSGSHCLIAGTTGCGKSVLIHAIMAGVMEMLPSEAELWLCDPKMVELSRYEHLPHTAGYADTHADVLRLVQRVGEVMNARYAEMKRRGLRQWVGGVDYLIIDEMADLRIGPYGKEFTAELQRILQLGRAASIRCICATQAPNRRIIPAELVINYPQRVGMKCASSIESRQIVGVAGCEALPKHGLVIYADGADIRREEVPLTSDEDIDARVEWWRAQDVAAYACIPRRARRRPENIDDTIARARFFGAR